MTTDSPVRTHCPNCNAKLHRQDLSLCAYCATPLSLGGKIDRPNDETIRRLERLREKPEYAAAIGAKPFDPDVLAAMNRATSSAWALLLIAVVAGAAVVFAGGAFSWSSPLVIVPLAVGVVALALFARAASLRSRERALPLVRRPALVTDRRSETAAKGGRAATVYFFTMRFDDGSEGEFHWSGQGTMNEPLTPGVTGIAYTRSMKLVEFKRL